jgi:hypothetical protein
MFAPRVIPVGSLGLLYVLDQRSLLAGGGTDSWQAG